MNKNKRSNANEITPHQWLDHFQSLLFKENQVPLNRFVIQEQIITDENDHLNVSITDTEIEISIRKLKVTGIGRDSCRIL